MAGRAAFTPCVDDLLQRSDVRRRGAAAAAHHVEPLVLEELLVEHRHVHGSVVAATHRVRKTGVRVHVHEALDTVGRFTNRTSSKAPKTQFKLT